MDTNQCSVVSMILTDSLGAASGLTTIKTFGRLLGRINLVIGNMWYKNMSVLITLIPWCDSLVVDLVHVVRGPQKVGCVLRPFVFQSASGTTGTDAAPEEISASINGQLLEWGLSEEMATKVIELTRSVYMEEPTGTTTTTGTSEDSSLEASPR